MTDFRAIGAQSIDLSSHSLDVRLKWVTVDLNAEGEPLGIEIIGGVHRLVSRSGSQMMSEVVLMGTYDSDEDPQEILNGKPVDVTIDSSADAMYIRAKDGRSIDQTDLLAILVYEDDLLVKIILDGRFKGGPGYNC